MLHSRQYGSSICLHGHTGKSADTIESVAQIHGSGIGHIPTEHRDFLGCTPCHPAAAQCNVFSGREMNAFTAFYGYTCHILQHHPLGYFLPEIRNTHFLSPEVHALILGCRKGAPGRILQFPISPAVCANASDGPCPAVAFFKQQRGPFTPLWHTIHQISAHRHPRIPESRILRLFPVYVQPYPHGLPLNGQHGSFQSNPRQHRIGIGRCLKYLFRSRFIMPDQEAVFQRGPHCQYPVYPAAGE